MLESRRCCRNPALRSVAPTHIFLVACERSLYYVKPPGKPGAIAYEMVPVSENNAECRRRKYSFVLLARLLIPTIHRPDYTALRSIAVVFSDVLAVVVISLVSYFAFGLELSTSFCFGVFLCSIAL